MNTNRVPNTGTINYKPFLPEYMAITSEKKLQTKNILELKNKILEELDNPGIPDLKKLFTGDSLEVIFDVLKDLLRKEKAKFKKNLKIPKEKMNFDTFNEPSPLDYLFGLLDHFEAVNSNDKTRDIIEKFQPLYVDFGNEVIYNKDFYESVVYIRNNTELDDEQKRILDIEIRNFEISGIHLPEEKKEILKKLNKKGAELSFKFNNNKLDSQKEFTYVFESDESIATMPEDNLRVAKAKAEKDGLTGWKFTSDSTSMSAVLRYCTDSNIRKHFYNEWSRFASEGKFDNRKNILEILEITKEKSVILGYNNSAEMLLRKKMANSPEEVVELISQIGDRAMVKGKKDLEEIKTHFKIDEINAWDVSYYSRLLKEEKYSISDKLLKPYYEIERVIEGMFDIAKRLFGIEMVPTEVPKYDDEIRVFKVMKEGKFISNYILDIFCKPEKQSGAWANSLRSKFEYAGKKRDYIVVNVCSFEKGENGKTLLTGGDAMTLFHEFGHALHLMLSESKYPDLSGFKVEWDFVEVPSQMQENWFAHRDSKKTFAFHHETGEVISEEILDRMEKAKKFNSGLSALGMVSYTLIDMFLYKDNPPKTIEELDAKVLEIEQKYSLFDIDPKNKTHTAFSHIFGGGYAAGYYSYTWAEIYEADIFAEFKKNGVFDKATGDRYLNHILSQGSKKPAKELFFDFMGREVSLDAYYDRFGF